MIKTIAFDGDDTLWEHESFFTDVKTRYKEIILGYTDADGVRDKITDTQIKNLDVFGYGVKGFTLSMVETAIEVTKGKISADHIQELINLGKELLKHPIVLLKNIEETLKVLHDSGDYQLLVITKGELSAQESKYERSGLQKFFDDIDVVTEKDITTYQNIFLKRDIKPEEFLMVGNSIKSDIMPILELGGEAVHIPFHITWAHEHVELAETDKDKFLMIDNAADLLPILEWHKQYPEQQITAFKEKID